jgi:hypothetical protein
LLLLFSRWGLVNYWSGLTSNHNPLISVSQVPRITGVSHWCLASFSCLHTLMSHDPQAWNSLYYTKHQILVFLKDGALRTVLLSTISNKLWKPVSKYMNFKLSRTRHWIHVALFST